MSEIGFVATDADGKWIGGRYYLHHLIKCVAALPDNERMTMCDVWWRERPEGEDPFAEVRNHLTGHVVISPPSGIFGRLLRKTTKMLTRQSGIGDLFSKNGVKVLFPRLPCASPGIPYIFWLADFQYLHFPDLFGSELCGWYQENYRRNVDLADQIVVSSKHALMDFSKEYPEHMGKVNVLHFCSVPDDEWWMDDPEAVAAQYDLPERFFILSNQFSDHKNHAIVFDAVRRLREKGVEVTIACTGSTWGFRGEEYFQGLTDFIDKHGLHDSIRILGMLPRSHQVALMRRSIAMLQPSMFEGWSTIVEDARTLGKELLVSSIEVHREQLGDDYPYYLPVDDAAKWADAMEIIYSGGSPGPDIRSEKAALKCLERRRLECGRVFVDVVSKAMACGK